MLLLLLLLLRRPVLPDRHHFPYLLTTDWTLPLTLWQILMHFTETAATREHVPTVQQQRVAALVTADNALMFLLTQEKMISSKTTFA